MAEIIVMIHGMFGGGWYWHNYKRFFEEKGYQCHAPTLRYHDMYPKDRPNPALGVVSLTDYVNDLQEYVLGLGQKPFLMGHSMGGLLAQILCARKLGKGLILLTPSPPSGVDTFLFSALMSFWSILTKWGFWRNPYRLSFEAASYSMLQLLPQDDQKATYARFVYESGRAAAEIGFWFLDLKRAARVNTASITCPVLVVSGSKDRMTPAPLVRKIARKYRTKATYKEFENHAHWVIGEPGWEKIAAFVSKWLENIIAGVH